MAFQAGGGNSDQSRTGSALEQTGDAVEAGTKETVNQASDDFERDCDQAVVNLEDERAELDRKISELKTKIDNKTDKASAELKRQLAKFEHDHRDLDTDIDKAKKAGQFMGWVEHQCDDINQGGLRRLTYPINGS